VQGFIKNCEEGESNAGCLSTTLNKNGPFVIGARGETRSTSGATGNSSEVRGGTVGTRSRTSSSGGLDECLRKGGKASRSGKIVCFKPPNCQQGKAPAQGRATTKRGEGKKMEQVKKISQNKSVAG